MEEKYELLQETITYNIFIDDSNFFNYNDQYQSITLFGVILMLELS